MNRPGEDTLIRYFRGQCPPEEAAAVRLYLATGQDSDYVQACLQEAWQNLEQPGAPIGQTQLDEKWQEFEMRNTGVIRSVRPGKVWLRYAAAAVILLTGALTYSLYRGKDHTSVPVAMQYQTFSAPKGHPKKITLADGTAVTLFPGSAIQLPADYNERERNVLLEGRAFFDVAQNVQKPFYVKTAQLSTRVLGTSFDVTAHPQDASSKVTLVGGRVAVSYATKEIATLDPGQQVVFDSVTHNWQINQVNAQDAAAWTTGEFIYEHAPLQQVLHDIENWYDVQINTDSSSISRQEITTNFKQLPLERVLSMIAKASGQQYTISGKVVTMRPGKH